MNVAGEHTTPMVLVAARDLAALTEAVRELQATVEAAGVASDESSRYVEPGPNSERQYFTSSELQKRFGWGKTKLSELTEDELPRFKHGQSVRFFWAHVWAFEGRISRQTANRIFTNAVQATGQTPPANQTGPTGLRPFSGNVHPR